MSGAEEPDTRSVREEEQPELENLVVLGKGLSWCSAFSADTGNEECRKQEATDFRVQDFGVAKETDEYLQHVSIARTEGEALKVVRGAEREPGLEQLRRLAALHDPLAAGRSFGRQQANLVPTNSFQT